jgi:predicted transcriptional regulator
MKEIIKKLLKDQKIKPTKEGIWVLETLLKTKEQKRKTLLSKLKKDFKLSQKEVNTLLTTLNKKGLIEESKIKGVVYHTPSDELRKLYWRLKVGETYESAEEFIQDTLSTAEEKLEKVEGLLGKGATRLGNFLIKKGEKMTRESSKEE